MQCRRSVNICAVNTDLSAISLHAVAGAAAMYTNRLRRLTEPQMTCIGTTILE